MAAKLVRARRNPLFFFEGKREAVKGRTRRERGVYVLLKLGLILVCALAILVLVLVVPVISGTPMT